MGASLTGGGMTRGRGGSDMEPWTGVFLGILRLAMVVSEKTARGARSLLRQRGQTGGCSGLAHLWYLFEVQMTD